MSTNFYWASCDPDSEDADNIHDHIGKSSAAGYQCAACGIPQVKSWRAFHSPPYEGREHEKCPGCGQNFTDPFFTFTWTMLSHKRRLEALAEEEAKRYRHRPQEDWTNLAERDGLVPVYSEYRQPFSATEFLKYIEDSFHLISSHRFF